MTQDSLELTDGPASLDLQARKETQAFQESLEDQEVLAPKEQWEKWVSQALRDRRALPVCLVGLEVPGGPELLVSLELKVNLDQLELAPQEYRDPRESQDSQVSQGLQG